MHDLDSPSLPDLVKPQERHERRRRRSHSSPWRKLRRRLRRINYRLVLIVAVSVLAVVIMGSLVLVFNARSQVEDAWSGLSRVMARINNTPGIELTLADFERLQASIGELDQRLGGARQQTSFLRPFEFLSAEVALTFDTLDAARELTQAARSMLNGMEPMLSFLTEGEQDEAVNPQFSSAARVVELLELGRGAFLSADSHLRRAETLLAELDLDKASPDLVVAVGGLIDHQEQVREINDLLLDSPELLTVALGLDTPQSYLVLSANSDELRPSGGYISTYGWMTVRNGRIAGYNYNPTTANSPNPPPESMADAIQIPPWWIQYARPIYAAWDSSWHADFPSTAAMAAWYYDNGGNPSSPVNGVIGIDLVGFEYVLRGLGSVTVPGYGDVITVENFRDAVYEIRAEGDDNAHKRFVAALYRQILADWQRVDPERNADLRREVLQALREKHIMLYFTDERLNEAIAGLGWSGKQASGQGRDYLMVADANLGSKSSRSVLRQTTYDVTVQPDGTLNSSVTVSYDFPARVAEQDPAVRPDHYNDINYHTILQVFTPAQSVLLDSENTRMTPTAASSANHTIFVSELQVNYDDSLRVQYHYQTPEIIQSIGRYRRYELQVQKQPGTIAEQVDVQLRLPPGAETISVSPAPTNSYQLEQPILEFRFNLQMDQSIEVVFAD